MALVILQNIDSHAVRGWLLEHLVAPGAGQERSHAAWRSFFSKTMLPMQRGARSGPQGCRQERFHGVVLAWSWGDLGVHLRW